MSREKPDAPNRQGLGYKKKRPKSLTISWKVTDFYRYTCPACGVLALFHNVFGIV